MRRGRDRIQETGQGQETGYGVPGIGHTRHQGMPQGTRHQGKETGYRTHWPGIMDRKGAPLIGYRTQGTRGRILDAESR
jgi:hypothetical protein